jgi:Brp/Blh family beta-carotene 15,15'-monooxygenase
MNKISFYFLSIFLIIVPVFAGLDTVTTTLQLLGALLFIILLGIPHGAIDHIIFLEDNNTAKPIHFYSFYFGLMGLYLFAWALFPMFSLILFLILSSYHFGQSQFSDLASNRSLNNHILHFAWGASILSGLTFYHINDIHALSSLSSDLYFLPVIFNKTAFPFLLLGSSFIFLFALVLLKLKKQISTERLFFEIYLFVLIHICFYILPLIIGFTLYFVILHSFKVLSEEFNYLKQKRKDFTFHSFVKMLIPFSLISILGGVTIMLCAHFSVFEISNVLLAFVLISVLTLPHSIVMDNFYQKFMPSTF